MERNIKNGSLYKVWKRVSIIQFFRAVREALRKNQQQNNAELTNLFGICLLMLINQFDNSKTKDLRIFSEFKNIQ